MTCPILYTDDSLLNYFSSHIIRLDQQDVSTTCNPQNQTALAKRQDCAFPIDTCPPPGNPNNTIFMFSKSVVNTPPGKYGLYCSPPGSISLDPFDGTCPPSHFSLDRPAARTKPIIAWCVPQEQVNKTVLRYENTQVNILPMPEQEGTLLLLKYHNTDRDFKAARIDIGVVNGRGQFFNRARSPERHSALAIWEGKVEQPDRFYEVNITMKGRSLRNPPTLVDVYVHGWSY